MFTGKIPGIPVVISQKLVLNRNNASLAALKKIFRASKVRLSEWKSIKIPPVQGSKLLKNRYIPFSKRFLFREIVSDYNIISPGKRDAFERIALFIDEKIRDQYRLQAEEISLLLKRLVSSTSSSLNQSELTDAEIPSKEELTRNQRLDQEYWFLRKLAEIAPAAGFTEVSQESLQECCLPRVSRTSRVKTYVNPADYDVLRIWTRGLHPSIMYPIDRSSRQLPSTGVPGLQGNRLLAWLNKFLRLITPRAMAAIPREDLCYGHVLVAYRLKQDNSLRLRMMKHVPVSATANANLFAEGIIDMLPEHRYLGLSQISKVFIAASGAVAAGSLFIVTPFAFLVGSSSSQLVLAWSLTASAVSVAIGAVVSLRYWKVRAEWSERLRMLSLICEFNSGSFALAHFLGLSQAELYKSALLVYSLLLQPSASQTPLNLPQLEIRVESWIARRLSPRAHINLPPSTDLYSPSRILSKLFPNTRSEPAFEGGSGPLFDLQFDARPALQLLRQLDLVRGSEEKLEAVPIESVSSSLTSSPNISFPSALNPESEEDDLGFPRVTINQ